MVLRREKLSDVLTRKIVALIRTEGFQPGERFLSDRELARHFKVSHLSVRAALSNLEKAKVIGKRPRSGTFVLSLPAEEARRRGRSAGASTGGNGKMVAVLMRTEGHYYFDLMNAICSRLRDAGLFPVLISMPPEDKHRTDIRQLQEAVSMGCRRIIIQAELRHWSDPAFKKLGILGDGKTPFDRIVWFANTDKLPEFQKGVLVGIDSRKAMRIQVGHLKDLGHRKIAFVTNEIPSGGKYPEIESYGINAFSSVMAELGLANGISVIAQGNNLEENKRRMEELLERKDRPSALIGAGDYRVATAADIARSKGIRIPKDLALVGTFDTPWAKHYGLTSLSYNIEGMAEAILDEITKVPVGKDRSVRLIEPKLIVRHSCGASRKVAVLCKMQ